MHRKPAWQEGWSQSTAQTHRNAEDQAVLETATLSALQRIHKPGKEQCFHKPVTDLLTFSFLVGGLNPSEKY